MSETRILATPVGEFEVPLPVFAHLDALRVTNIDLNEQLQRANETAHRRVESLESTTDELVRERELRERAQGLALDRGQVLDAARRELAQVRQNAADELDDFKARVRNLAIEKAAELGWCDQGLNEALTTLGLEPKATDYRVRVTVMATREFEVRVSAPSTRAAWESVDAWDTEQLTDALNEIEEYHVFRDWDHHSQDSSTSVELWED